MLARLCFLVALLLEPACSLLLQPRVTSPALQLRARATTMQFGLGGGDGEKREGLTRENEPDEFFSTNMDDMSDEEKLKSPVVIGGLILLIAPFIVGAIALQFNR